jgi:hypothetical protein
MRLPIVCCGALWLAIGCGATEPGLGLAHEEEPRTCDDFVSEQPVEIPREQTLAATCGDETRGEYVASCVERCSNYCSGNPECVTECTRATETCDGPDLGGETCASLGFGAGTLACQAGCVWRELSECRVCNGPGCHEVTVDPALAPTDDVRLVESGRRVRAFWLAEVDETSHLISATVGPDATLTDAPLDLGITASVEVVATSAGWIAVGYEHESIVVKAIDVRGRIETHALDLPDDVGEVRMLATNDGALVMAGLFHSNAVPIRLVGPRGAPVPLPPRPVHAADHRDRVVIVPLSPGARAIRVADGAPFTMDATDGDRFVAWIHLSSSCAGGAWCYGGANLLHGGVTALAEGSDALDPPALTITIDGTREIAFSPEGDTVDGARFAIPAIEPIASAPFPSIVPRERIVRAGARFSAVFDPDADGPAPTRFVLGASD